MRLLALLTLCLSAQAATLYVQKTGSSDANACTDGAPCLTIARAYSLASAGDIVQVSPGTYSEAVVMNRAGTSGNKITIQGYAVGGACPQETVSDINHPTGWRPQPDVIVNSINISADWNRVDCLRTSSGGIVTINTANVNDVDVIRCRGEAAAGGSVGIALDDQLSLATSVQNFYAGYNYFTGGGYGILQKCRNCRYEYNEIYRLNPGSSGADGDYSRVFGNDITFYRNYFHGNDRNLCGGQDCHIDCWQTFAYTSDFPAYNITIDSNVCMQASEGVIATNESLLSVFHDWTIKNNLIAHSPLNYSGLQCMIISDITNVNVFNNTCTDAGTLRFAKSTSAVVRNNIVERIGTYLPILVEGSPTLTVTDNLFYDSGYTYTYAGNIVNQAPSFVNAAADDYRLQTSSPAKDAGANVGVTLDLLGYTRPVGAGYDIGAYEFGGASGVAPTITTTSPLPAGTVGTAYSQTLTATGDATITWAVTSGSLPAGLSLSSGGAITGTPTTAGTSTPTITATNGTGSDAKVLSITINAAPTGPTASAAGRVAISGKVTIK